MVMYILSDVYMLLSICFSPLVFKDVYSGRLTASSLIWSEVKCTGWCAIIATLLYGMLLPALLLQGGRPVGCVWTVP